MQIKPSSHPHPLARFARRFIAAAATAALGAVLALCAPAAAVAATVSAGYQTTCSVSDTGVPMCWGRAPLERFLPTDMMVDIRAGNGFACALLKDGGVACWGPQNESGQLGYPADSPVYGSRIGVVGTGNYNPLRAVQVAVGSRHACAIALGGDVYCWGDAGQGQMGFFEPARPLVTKAIPVQGLADAVRVSAGNGSTCAVHRSGGVSCVGVGSLLGEPGGDPRTVRRVPGISDAVDVSLFDGHGCVLRAGGQVACWGGNAYGQLGVPASAGTTTTPVAVPDLGAQAKAIAAGYGFSCALLQGGAIRCWGDNTSAQSGTGVGSQAPVTPAQGQVMGISDAQAISAGQTHACAALDGGYVQCWGSGLGVDHGACRIEGPYYPGVGIRPYPVFNLAVCFNSTGYSTPVTLKGQGPVKDAVAVMDWAERSMPQTFPNPGPGRYAPTDIVTQYIRAYPGGHYLAVNGQGTPHLMYFGPDSGGQLLDLGTLAHWARVARP